MNYTKDSDGFEWADNVGSARKETLHHDFVSMPFTKRSSPVEKGQVLPLIVHRAGANGPQQRQTIVEEKHNQFVEKQIMQWGESSPYTIDWNALNAATDMLVDGVISGDINKVRQALSNHADPNTTVSVRDPMALSTDALAQYVTLPIGVAAAIRGREMMVATGDKLSNVPFKEIASILLMYKNTPQVSVGVNPDGSGGNAIGYIAPGVKLYKDAGSEGFEQRVVAVPMSVASAVSAAAPLCIVDGAVPEATDGLVWGEALPRDARNNFMDLIDPEQVSFEQSLARFRTRRAAISAPSSLKINHP